MRAKTVSTALVAGATLTALVAAPASARTTVYKASLDELNGSAGSGTAVVLDKGDQLRVNVSVEGLLDATHLQHIHGFTDTTVATCPTAEDDADGDGFVNLLEGLPDYGAILVDLMPAEGSSYGFSRTFDNTIDNIADKHVVVHGVDVDGDGDLDGTKDLNGDGMIGGTDNAVLNLTEAAFELTMPALCGELSANGRG